MAFVCGRRRCGNFFSVVGRGFFIGALFLAACTPPADRTNGSSTGTNSSSGGGPILLSVSSSPIEDSEETITVDENIASVVFDLTLPSPLSSDLTVYYTAIDGTAKLTKDFYVGNNDNNTKDGTVTIPKGNVSARFGIPLRDDYYYEGDEEFVIGITTNQSSLVSVAKAGLKQKGYTIRIRDDETIPEISFLPPATGISVDVAESAGQKVIQIFSTAATDSYTIKIPVTYSYNALPGSSPATAGEDFIATKTITVPPSDIPNAIAPIYYSFLMNDDVIAEPIESVTVTLGQPEGAILAGGGVTSITFNIIDDDGAVKGAIQGTGIAQCASENNTTGSPCPVTGFPLQNGDIPKAFDINNYTKLGAGACVRDNATGLIWEIKTNDINSIGYFDHGYFWYDERSNTNGGSVGIKGDVKACNSTISSCDTQTYAKTLNDTAYCGYTNWRLPRVNELVSLLKLSSENPLLVKQAFDFTGADALYWSSTPVAGNSRFAWAVRFASPTATPYLTVDKILEKQDKNSKHYIRLVTTGP